MSISTSEKPVDDRFLRIHPRSYTEEPIAEDKLGGREPMRKKIAELIRENEALKRQLDEEHDKGLEIANAYSDLYLKEKKRSAVYKAVATKWYWVAQAQRDEE